ncbi:MAG TPA: TPM domain-containing protein [Methylophilus sp.]
MKRRHPIVRFFKHLCSTPWHVNRHFSAKSLSTIEKAIANSERAHAGEIRFVVEAGLHPLEILNGKSPQKRALELFGRLNIWDTEHNNGVLIYLLLADRDVEIVADRGIHHHVGADGWEQICHDMEVLFRKGEFEVGVLQGIAEISAALSQHFPNTGTSRNELPNRPIVM